MSFHVSLYKLKWANKGGEGALRVHGAWSNMIFRTRWSGLMEIYPDDVSQLALAEMERWSCWVYYLDRYQMPDGTIRNLQREKSRTVRYAFGVVCIRVELDRVLSKETLIVGLWGCLQRVYLSQHRSSEVVWPECCRWEICQAPGRELKYRRSTCGAGLSEEL